MGPGCRCTSPAQYVASTSLLAVRRQSGFHIISSRQRLEVQTFCDPPNIPEPVFSPHQWLQKTPLSLGQPSLPLLSLENWLVPGSSFNPKPELRVPGSCNGAGGPCSHLAVLLTPWFSFGVLFLPFRHLLLFVHDVILFSRRVSPGAHHLHPSSTAKFIFLVDSLRKETFHCSRGSLT